MNKKRKKMKASRTKQKPSSIRKALSKENNKSISKLKEKEKRYMCCTRCNQEWNVPINTKFISETYICPSCEGRLGRIEAANNAKKENRLTKRVELIQKSMSDYIKSNQTCSIKKKNIEASKQKRVKFKKVSFKVQNEV